MKNKSKRLDRSRTKQEKAKSIQRKKERQVKEQIRTSPTE